MRQGCSPTKSALQGGHFHVNLRTNEDVISIMESHGLVYDLETTQSLREHCQLDRLKGNVLVFHNIANATKA